MDLSLLLLKVMITIALLGFFSKLIQICDALILKPERLRSKLRKQGIKGPPPSFLLGNINDIKKMKSTASKTQPGEQALTHNCSSAVFPFFDLWRKQYGSTFMFSLGNIQILHMNHPDVVKEMGTCTSLNLGKPSYQYKKLGALLGHGILTSNGARWAHQRKILAPELYVGKVKDMMSLMVESSITLVNSWTNLIESEGGVADVHVDEYMRSFSGDVISRACFGSNYSEGEEIFSKLNEVQELLSKKVFSSGIPVLRHLPTKSKRETWRLEKEVHSLIMKVVKERKERASENDLLQMIIEVSATWTLTLLASNPEWQQRVRTEVLEICADQMPEAGMVRKMKTLTMVIHESLRLYPPVPVVSREAFQDMKFGDINVPKGVIVWTLMVALQQDPDIWGPDANIFRPESRGVLGSVLVGFNGFANGVSGACKLPYVYMPFGVGPHICAGQHFARAELKILLALIVSNSFSLSPKYRHSPAMSLLIEPEHGVNLLIKKL
ncbi:hypothetical protein RGQ29_017303 [Quercus rubra]|uniref:Cytochrome P450 n=1 Tax=Quercus rubra TaxID=3512 RepID=A0AAN7IXI6_QUERU|nr:hypothetical protein RGQ29_017303 [Quercus rubra]